MILKPYGKPLKNQNRKFVNQIKNENPSRAQITSIVRRQQPPQRNNIDIFSCLNCGKPNHMVKKCISKSKPHFAFNGEVNLNDEQFIVMITEINMVGLYVEPCVCRLIMKWSKSSKLCLNLSRF